MPAPAVQQAGPHRSNAACGRAALTHLFALQATVWQSLQQLSLGARRRRVPWAPAMSRSGVALPAGRQAVVGPTFEGWRAALRL